MFSDGLKKDLLDLNIRADPDKVSELRKEIKERLAPLHPDSNRGSFAGGEQEEDFHRLMGLLRRIDEEERAERVEEEAGTSTQLTVPDARDRSAPLASVAVPGIVSVPPELMAPPRRQMKRRYALPKITSALMAPVCLGLLLFIGHFKENPLYQNVVNYLAEEKKVNASRWFTVKVMELFETRSEIAGRALVFSELKGQVSRGVPDEKFLQIYVNPFGAEEPYILKDLEQNAADLKSKISTLLKKDARVLTEELRAAGRADPSMRARYEEYAREKQLPVGENPLPIPAEIATPEQLKGQEAFKNWYLDKLQEDAGEFSYKVTAAKADFVGLKETMIREADRVIMACLVGLTAAFGLAFFLLWCRERSDERWLEYLSSDDGLSFVFRRFCSNKRSRPHETGRFSATEFTRAISTKDVAPILAPLIGKRLDTKHLGKISEFLLNRLKEKNLIAEVEPSTIPAWYELRSVCAPIPEE